VVEELAVGRMVRFLHSLDMGADRGMLLGEEPREEVLLLHRADDEDGAGVRDPLSDILEERLVLLHSMTGALLPRVEVANDVIADQSPVRLVDVEVEDARLLVVDPDDRVKMGHSAPRRSTFGSDPTAPGRAAL
jgi:hypothetical protein